MPEFTVGLISDTHGLLRPQALDALAGSDAIIHAGDIGEASILDALSRLAPVTAVRGNVDTAGWASTLPTRAMLRAGGIVVSVIHDVAELDCEAGLTGVRVLVSGHSHRPAVQERHGVLFVNPGSAGPRRFSLPVSVGRLLVWGDRVHAEAIAIDTG